ncbi:MAG TPA: phospho-N-acetylmuramoyl-pentapeptide-transferase, partial [Dehalococcoidia bacterium]|nr:phospho-N-acetylmuramoyl-pentapeptide-transferase [Dehalococcoidia bacterium]
MAVTTVAGIPVLALLRRLKVGKEINPYGPTSHQAKAGTPTMGGLLILAAVIAVNGTANLATHHSIGLPLAAMTALGALGLIDDTGSLRGRQQRALSKRLKLVAFLAIGLAVAFGLYWKLDLSSINIPFAGKSDINQWYIPIAAVVLVLTAGGV